MPAERDDLDDPFEWDAPSEPQPEPESGTYGLAAPEPLPEPPPAVLPQTGPAAENRPTRRRRKKPRRPPREEEERLLEDDPPLEREPPPKREPPPIPPLISSVWYPLTGSGWWVVPFFGGLLGLMQLVPIPLIGSLMMMLVTLHVALLFLETANYTLEAIETGPRFPFLSLESLAAGMYGLTTVMIAGIPLIVGSVILNRLGVEHAVPRLLLLACSMLYVPMGFLALAELENEHALNPLIVFRGMRRMKGRYFVLVGIAVAAFVVPAIAFSYFIPYQFFELPLRAVVLIYTTTALMRAVAISSRRKRVSFE